MNTSDKLRFLRNIGIFGLMTIQIIAVISAYFECTIFDMVCYYILVSFLMLELLTTDNSHIIGVMFCLFSWFMLTESLVGRFFGVLSALLYFCLYFAKRKCTSKSSSRASKKKKDKKNQPSAADLKELEESSYFIQHARIPFLRIPIPGFYYKIDCTPDLDPALEMHCLWFFFLDRDSDGKIRWLGMVDRILIKNIHNVEEKTSSQGQYLTGVTDLEIPCTKVAENHQDHWEMVPKRMKNLMLYEWRLKKKGQDD